MKNFKCFLLFVFTWLSLQVRTQTLIINEVSNGPSGAKEYVEFVVVSNTISYSCNNAAPPCIDIRGWIYDDNSGYHGADGIASGAIRFSQDPLWACIPLGTIIVIYNNADPNPALPPNDLSLSDGNCRIIAPINNTSLFEKNTTTPGASVCSYPTTGWVAGGDWAYTALFNTSDCARIVNLAGCEVFSLCYGPTDNLNNLIYFSATGGQTVYYFNDVNPSVQSNWSIGSASPSPGNQTPGAANNAANAAYIGQFNNGCQPITPINVTASSVNAGCTCNGSATANATGSIAGYTYAWYDSGFNPIGQTGAIATNLCAGVYNVIATSHIGCSDTTSVTISVSSSTLVTVNSQTICIGSSTVLTATPSMMGGTYSWTPGGQTTQTISISPTSTTNYSVTYALSGCSDTGTCMVTVIPIPTITVNSPTICAGQSVTLTANGAATYNWDSGSNSNPLIVSPTTSTNYMVTGTTSGCTNTTIANVVVNPSPIITVNSPSICAGQSATLIANGSNTYSWNTGSTSNSLTVTPASTSNYTITGITAGCSNTAIATVSVNPLPILTVNSPTICTGQTATITANGASTFSWNTGAATSSITDNPSVTATYTVIGTTLGCSNTATTSVTISSNLILTANSPTICEGQTATLNVNGANTYSWNTGSTSNPLNVSPLATSVYTVTGTTASCVGSLTITVNVAASPNISFNSTSPSGCAPLCVQFSDLTTVLNGAISSWDWSFDDGTGSSIPNPSHCFNTAGLYDISLTVTSSNGCIKKITNNNMIDVYPIPISAFTTNVDITDILDPTIQFINHSSNATLYNWNFGDLSSSTQISPNHTYSQEGTYTTTLIATNTNGCKNIAIHEIIINDIFTFYAPNTFTPNQDNINDIFLPLGVGWNPDKYQLTIFDRWGNNCFSTHDVNMGWDGKANNGNETAQIDTYTWKVALVDLLGKKHKFIGSITILR